MGTTFLVADRPSARRPSPRSLAHVDRERTEWRQSEDRQPTTARTAQHVHELPEGPDLPARDEDVYGLAALIGDLRGREQPPDPPIVVGHREIERNELRIEDGNMYSVVTIHRRDGRVHEVARNEVHLRPPLTPRFDEDGDLILTGGRHGAKVEIRRVNRSYILKVDFHGDVRELFWSDRRSVTAGSELGWHRLARAYGLPPGSRVVKRAQAMRPRRSTRNATGIAATRVDQHLTASAVFEEVAEPHRMVTRRDLRLLDRHDAYSLADPMPQALGTEFGDLLSAYGVAPKHTFAVDVIWHVGETWHGHSTAHVFYSVGQDDPMFPPLVDTGRPGPAVSVDSFGHVHEPDGTWRCDACDRWYCKGCGKDGAFVPCPDCMYPTCPKCLRVDDREVGVGQCQLCGITACATCGRDPQTVHCGLCLREACESCRHGPVCTTCEQLHPVDPKVIRLPAELAASGCVVWSGSDADADVILIRGRGRREVALLRNDRLSTWITFEEPQAACLQVLLARATGVHCAVPDLYTRGGEEEVTIGRAVSARIRLPTGETWTVHADHDGLRDRVVRALHDGDPLPSASPWSHATWTWPPAPTAAWPALEVQARLRLRGVSDDGIECVDPSDRILEFPWTERRPAEDPWFGDQLVAEADGYQVVTYVTGRDVRVVLEGGGTPTRRILRHAALDLLRRRVASSLGFAYRRVEVVAAADPSASPVGPGVSTDRELRPIAHFVNGDKPMETMEVAELLELAIDVDANWESVSDAAGITVTVRESGRESATVALAWDVTEWIRPTPDGDVLPLRYQLVPTEAGTQVLIDSRIQPAYAGEPPTRASHGRSGA